MNYSHLKEAKRALADLPSSDRINAINSDFWIDCPQTTTIIRIIQNILSAKNRQQAPCLLVCGGGGTGKTSLITKLKKTNENLGIKAAFTNLSENPDGLRFRDQILVALGVSIRSEHGYKLMPHGVDKFIELRGYRGLVLDEFHDSLLAPKHEQRKNLSLLKTLSGEPFRLSVIGFGTSSALNALQQDRQLERRFEIIQLRAWEETDEFRSFLAAIEENIPIKKPSHIYEREFVRFLLSETDGSMDEIIKVIRFGAIQAVLSGEERITIDGMKQGIKSRWNY